MNVKAWFAKLFPSAQVGIRAARDLDEHERILLWEKLKLIPSNDAETSCLYEEQYEYQGKLYVVSWNITSSDETPARIVEQALDANDTLPFTRCRGL